MRSKRRGTELAGIGLWVALTAAGGSGSPGRRAAHPATGRPAHVQVDHPRAAPAPEILLTGSTRETRAAEARAAAFVQAIRHRNGPRAARFLSRETAPAVRAAVAQREWPWRQAPEDLALLFARPALRLRTLGMTRRHARVRLGPQHLDRHSREAVGFYDLGMVWEEGRWQVTLPRPGRPLSGRGRKA